MFKKLKEILWKTKWELIEKSFHTPYMGNGGADLRDRSTSVVRTYSTRDILGEVRQAVICGIECYNASK
jgi:hypothetical protein